MRRLRWMLLFMALLLLVGCRETQTPQTSAPEPASTVENSQASTAADPGEALALEEVYGCKALSLRQTGKQALLDLYREALADGREKGYIPVIVYENERLDQLFSAYFEPAGGREAFVSGLLAQDHGDGRERLAAMLQELREFFDGEPLEVTDEALDLCLREFGPALGSSDFPSVPSLILSSDSPWLLRVPVEQPWEIFAWLPNCGWNTCPDVDTMMAVCRYWYEQYGAVPAMMSYDTLVFYLESPVTDRETAKALALEQTAFCDGVFEMGGPELYAASALNSNFWSFWWD